MWFNNYYSGSFLGSFSLCPLKTLILDGQNNFSSVMIAKMSSINKSNLNSFSCRNSKGIKVRFFFTVHPAVAGFAASTWGLSFSGSISSGDLCGEGKGFAPQSESIFSPFAKDGGGSEDAGTSTEHCGVGDAWGEE